MQISENVVFAFRCTGRAHPPSCTIYLIYRLIRVNINNIAVSTDYRLAHQLFATSINTNDMDQKWMSHIVCCTWILYRNICIGDKDN